MGFEQLRSIIEYNRRQAELGEQEELGIVKRTFCPICAWPLEETEDGTLHCAFDGWTDGFHLKGRC